MGCTRREQFVKVAQISLWNASFITALRGGERKGGGGGFVEKKKNNVKWYIISVASWILTKLDIGSSWQKKEW